MCRHKFDRCLMFVATHILNKWYPTFCLWRYKVIYSCLPFLCLLCACQTYPALWDKVKIIEKTSFQAYFFFQPCTTWSEQTFCRSSSGLPRSLRNRRKTKFLKKMLFTDHWRPREQCLHHLPTLTDSINVINNPPTQTNKKKNNLHKLNAHHYKVVFESYAEGTTKKRAKRSWQCQDQCVAHCHLWLTACLVSHILFSASGLMSVITEREREILSEDNNYHVSSIIHLKWAIFSFSGS